MMPANQQGEAYYPTDYCHYRQRLKRQRRGDEVSQKHGQRRTNAQNQEAPSNEAVKHNGHD